MERPRKFKADLRNHKEVMEMLEKLYGEGQGITDESKKDRCEPESNCKPVS